MNTPITIHSHNYQHFQYLQLSADDFYTRLQKKIAEFEYPHVSCKRVPSREAGYFSMRREYLSVQWGQLDYYVCAAPFGKSFFVSWWLREKEDAVTRFFQRLPFIGWLFRHKKTYFEVDSELIFTKSIDSIIKTVIATVIEEKGKRKPLLAEAN